MSWGPLYLEGLSFLGPRKKPSYISFQRGLNVICGASDTGKSFIAEAIDFMLGGGSPLRDISERVGYDKARLLLGINEEEITIERSTSGGDFLWYRGKFLIDTPNIQPEVLGEQHAHNKEDTLSFYLLTATGLENSFVRTNQKGNTRSLSFRDLARLVVIQETEITERHSPFLSGQWVTKTVNRSILKLLLTGVDDSGFIVQHEQTQLQEDNSAKIELIDELLDELQKRINATGFSRASVQDNFQKLESSIELHSQRLEKLQVAVSEKLQVRREVLEKREQIHHRLDEIEALIARFSLLQSHYKVDINRLAAIQESGSLFIHLEKKPCPLCGASPQEEHKGIACDGDIKEVVYAASAEIDKIDKLASELVETMTDLRDEQKGLMLDWSKLDRKYNELDQEIRNLMSPRITELKTIFTDQVSRASQLKEIAQLFDRLDELTAKKAEMNSAPERKYIQAHKDKPQVDLSESVIDAYSQHVLNVLQRWHYPNANRVHFDTKVMDVVIDGKPRTSRGKGLRAITHAAMNVALLDFCRKRNLAHPGFLVMDSPLLAYWKPEGPDDDLKGTDLKERFYIDLANNYSDCQIIIIENEHPPQSVHDDIRLEVFTKNPSQGRYGFFPHLETKDA